MNTSSVLVKKMTKIEVNEINITPERILKIELDYEKSSTAWKSFVKVLVVIALILCSVRHVKVSL